MKIIVKLAAVSIAVIATLLTATVVPVQATNFGTESLDNLSNSDARESTEISADGDIGGGFVNPSLPTEGTPVTTIVTADGNWYQPRISVPTPGISYRKYSNRWYTISTKTADTIVTKAIGGVAGSFGGVLGGIIVSELMPSNVFRTGYTYEHLILSYARDSVNTYIKMEGWAYKDKAHKHLLYHNTSYQRIPRK